MRKLLLTAAAVLSSATMALAQFIPSAYKVEAGANFSNLTNSNDTKSSMLIGYRVGAGVEFNIKKGIYINPSILFLSRGDMYSTSSELNKALATKATTRNWFHCIEIPVHVGYRMSLIPSLSLSVQAGPYLSYAFKGVSSTSGKVLGSEVKNMNINLFEKGGILKDGAFNQFDFGLGGQAALEYSRYYLACGVEYGFINAEKSDSFKSHHYNIFTSLGVRF